LWLFFHRDEVICLDEYEQGLRCLSTPYWKLDRAWLDQTSQFPKLAPIAAMITPSFRMFAQFLPAMEANLALARCELVAYRRGAEAARAEAARTIDPFVGEPLHFRVDPDGVLVFWSVGTNGVDNGGTSTHPPPYDPSVFHGLDYVEEDPEQPLDIVWKLRLN